MKIGILTLPLVSNNGGILQAYALQKFLQKSGHEVVLLDRQNPAPIFHRELRMIKNYILGKKFLKHGDYQKLNENPTQFISKYISPKSPVLKTDNELCKFIDNRKLDAIVVGSDQVWRIEYSGKLKFNFFLDFKLKNNIKKVGYAASFGVDFWKHDPELTNKVGRLLEDFDAISVREKSGVKICENVFGVNAVQNIDPTLLLNKEHYIKLIDQEKEKRRDGELFYYFLDETQSKLEIVERCSAMLKIKAYKSEKEFFKEIGQTVYRKSNTVTSWLRCFYDAEYVLTDSFHACVFSIIFNKPFFVIGNVERGLARFESILEQLDLRNRLILEEDEILEDVLRSAIDYEKVNKLIEEAKLRSKSFFDSIS
ncbi:polysaccharide pyruvyl transferase family protein [Sunxiuqinia indica]|uniref:polysaccharide pyruvyl transferase family protein n=1 Tax=Sunxiuqinia indica TaxID=2692584 RepID=UPI00135B3698|nr:polysaccharide pyruvyl transferase family protein [Sunxiuqinia indica]